MGFSSKLEMGPNSMVGVGLDLVRGLISLINLFSSGGQIYSLLMNLFAKIPCLPGMIWVNHQFLMVLKSLCIK